MIMKQTLNLSIVKVNLRNIPRHIVQLEEASEHKLRNPLKFIGHGLIRQRNIRLNKIKLVQNSSSGDIR